MYLYGGLHEPTEEERRGLVFGRDLLLRELHGHRRRCLSVMARPVLAQMRPRPPATAAGAPVDAVTRWVHGLIYLGLTLCGAVGCYRPSIKDGGLMCAEATLACPDGYVCLSGRCRSPDQRDASTAPDTGADRAEASDGEDADAAKEAGSDADSAMCVVREPLTGCTPKA